MVLFLVETDAHYVQKQDIVRPLFGHKALAKRMKSYYDGTGGAKGCGRRNAVIDGMRESHKFLDFVRQNGNEKLFEMLEAMRNETEFLLDVGKEEKRREPNKHPGTNMHSLSLSVCSCVLSIVS